MRTYAQYCGLACALELVGERWALLIVRDLLVGPKRFTDLRHGLPRIPTNILSSRLKELEAAGVVCRRVRPLPASGIVYELTEYGRELEDILLRLGLWGAKTMREARAEDTLNADSAILGLRALFHPEAARGLTASYELRLGGLVVHARIDRGTLEANEGPLEEPDLVLETDFSFRAVLTGEVGLEEAVEGGKLRLVGDRELLEPFVEAFRIPPVTAGSAS